MSERVRSAPAAETKGPSEATSVYAWFLEELFRAGPTGLDIDTFFKETKEGTPSCEQRIAAYQQAVAARLVCIEPSTGRMYRTPDKARFQKALGAAQTPDKQAPNEAEAAA